MQKHIDKIYNYLAGLLIIVFPLSKALPNIILPLLVVLFIATYKKASFRSLKKGYLLVFYGLMAYVFIKGAITQSLFTEFNIFNKLLIIMLLPVLFTRVTNTLFIKWSLFISIYATILVSLCASFIYYIKSASWPFNTGIEVNRLLVLERPYQGFYALVGVVLSLHLAQYFSKYKWILRASSALAVVFIVIIAARLSLLSLLVILFAYIFFYSSMQKKTRAMLAGTAVGLITIAVCFSSSLSKRFFVNDSIETAIDYEPRIVIWNCAWHMLQHTDYSFATGFSSYKKVEGNYVQCFAEKIDNPGKKAWFVETRFNSHNQFNDFMLVHGLIGFLLLVTAMVWWFIYERNTFTWAAITLGIIFFMLVENIFYRQMGCYIFGLLLGITLLQDKDKAPG